MGRLGTVFFSLGGSDGGDEGKAHPGSAEAALGRVEAGEPLVDWMEAEEQDSESMLKLLGY